MGRCRTFALRRARPVVLDRYRREFVDFHSNFPRHSEIQFPSMRQLARAQSEPAVPSTGSLFALPTRVETPSSGSLSPPQLITPLSTPATSPILTQSDFSDPPSPMDTSESPLPHLQLAVVRTFDPENPLLALDSVIGDPTLRTLYRIALPKLPPTASIEDVLPVVHEGKHSFVLRPILAHQYRRCLDTLAAIIHCALNDHNPLARGSGHQIPMHLPQRALVELNKRMPAISLFRGHIHQTFEDRLFPSCEAVLEHAIELRKVCMYNFHWAIDGMRITLDSGAYSSCINWGAYLGVAKTEWAHRAGRTFHYGGYSDLAVYMSNKAEQSEMDFACARLITPNTSHLLITRDDRDPMDPACWIATWPLSADQHLEVVEREPAAQLVRWSLAEDGLEERLESLLEDSDEESMDVDPVL
ncbi:hypothetical protein C8R43DRAFT_951673 [Mycena crocata]|nr:hypothetical protein C8R43DRAFT_951673 [Mycena crocata]